jgi:hypothetical protein
MSKPTSSDSTTKSYPADHVKRERQTKPLKFFRVVYNNQKLSSRKREHPAPSYSFDDFINWLIEQPHLTDMWNTYQKSEHDKMFAPSIDRLDDDKPYSLDNIALMTWKENFDKSRMSIRHGSLNKGKTSAKPVYQLDSDGSIIKEYPSASAAAEEHGVQGSQIRAVCVGTQKQTNGTFWRYQ